ncbi:MAG: YdiU family protein [Burkholderiales bacterium]|nr:YdiU family protein [Burkholderiales bacterium]
MPVRLEARFAGLKFCHAQVLPTPLPEPRMVHFNAGLAQELGFDGANDALLEILSGNRPWPGYTPLASVYAGHQFGSWVSQLGDGRALLIAEIAKPDGARVELQLKGSGRTPYSRGADGRAVLRSSIREYLCSEAMHALNVPTTRCLSLVSSPHPVMRERQETAAVVCRVSPSFVRFGHFEFFSHEKEALALLADHVISEHFSHIEGESRYRSWLLEVVERTAKLMARWQSLGFCHGVMNTDNFSILGLTLDYGPFGFMDAFRLHHVCNHSDYEGRYAYGAQPEIGLWNVSRLLQAALPLLSESDDEAAEMASEIYGSYAPVFSAEALRLWTLKLGLRDVREGDAALVGRFLDLLQSGRLDFTRGFRNLSRVGISNALPDEVRNEFAGTKGFDAWLTDYRSRLSIEGRIDAERAACMNRVNPKYVLRNHLAQGAIEKAEAGDYSEIETLMRLLSSPFDEQPGMESYAHPPPEALRHIEVGCSS